MKHLGDIRSINGAAIPTVDVITGGSPCQDLSVAGKRAGLAGERSGLFMEQLRIVKEMREHDKQSGKLATDIRPRYMVWENVPGALSSGKPKGEDFRIVLEETARIIEKNAVIPGPSKEGWHNAGTILGEGWSIAWRVHNAQFWGVPQRRRRITLIADFGGESAPEILFERNSVPRHLTQSCGEEQKTSSNAILCTMQPSGVISFQERAGKPGGGKGILIQHERTGALSTLNNQAVCQPILIEMSSTKNTIIENGISPTLTSRMGTGGNQVNAIMCMDDCMEKQMLTYGLSRGSYNAGFKSQFGFSIDKEIIATQTARGPGAVCTSANPWIVRKLTPLECERLDGFPDNWTTIGDWYDSKGKRHKAADSPRYKALGNSLALPFFYWVLNRISSQYDRPAKMGSLFSGIGGFDLCWAMYNGINSVLWSSEIEEFPMAVMKKHFGDEDTGIQGDVEDYL